MFFYSGGKTMKKLLVLVTSLMLLAGCSEPKVEKVTVCKGTSEGNDIVNTIKYVDEKVNSVTYQNTIVVSESLIDYIKTYADNYKETVKDIEGLTYDYTIEGTTVVETTTVDYTVADLSELAAAGLITTGENETVDYIDFTLTLKYMTDIGLTCEELEEGK